VPDVEYTPHENMVIRGGEAGKRGARWH